MTEPPETTRRAILAAAAERARLHDALRAAASERTHSGVTRDYEASRHFIDRITKANALSALAAAEPDALEYAVCFLEAHPLCPDSGFALRDIARSLKRADIPAPHAARIRTALLNIVAKPSRDEMRHLRQLALTVADEGFLHALDALVASGVEPGSGNAMAMTTYLTKHWDAPPWRENA